MHRRCIARKDDGYSEWRARRATDRPNRRAGGLGPGGRQGGQGGQGEREKEREKLHGVGAALRKGRP
jgi:hypothetical protein